MNKHPNTSLHNNICSTKIHLIGCNIVCEYLGRQTVGFAYYMKCVELVSQTNAGMVSADVCHIQHVQHRHHAFRERTGDVTEWLHTSHSPSQENINKEYMISLLAKPQCRWT